MRQTDTDVSREEQEILDLISGGESEMVDFKHVTPEARKIAKSISAFANHRGGRLLIGVEDDGRVCGCNVEEEAWTLQMAAEKYCEPSVEVAFSSLRIEGKWVLVAEVQEAMSKPVYSRDMDDRMWAYIRTTDNVVLASRIHLLAWQMSDVRRPTMLEYSEAERCLLRELKGGERFSINRFCRAHGVERDAVQCDLAKLYRFGIVRMRYEDGAWRCCV